MPLRIGCDLDGVLADMEGRLLGEARMLFGEPEGEAQPSPPSDATTDDPAGSPEAANLDAPPMPQRLSLTVSQQRRLWQHVRETENFWEDLEETEPGIVARFGELARVRHWEVLFLTKRPRSAGDTAQRQSQRWLARLGFEFPSVYVVNNSRGRIADALGLDVVLDDTPENCLDATTDSRARVIAVFRRPDQPESAAFARLGVHVVGSTAEGLDKMVEIDAAIARGPGVVDRLKRALGLNRPAGT